MDHGKIGNRIHQIRLEQRKTQKQLAQQLGVSDKAISKWERGWGCPDVSLLSALCAILQIDVSGLLSGCETEQAAVGGNMKKTSYFVCPECGNISVCTGKATVSCCGRTLQALEAKKAEEPDKLKLEPVEDEWYITTNHPAARDNYISFLAFATGDKLQILKQYPEWEIHTRIPRREHGTLLWYSTSKGLFYQLV